MKLMTTVLVAALLSASMAHAQEASTTLQNYKAPPTQQELDTMTNNGWNLISVVPVVANGISQYYVAYFDSLPPKASKGVNCTYEIFGSGRFSQWYPSDGPTDEDKAGKLNMICR